MRGDFLSPVVTGCSYLLVQLLWQRLIGLVVSADGKDHLTLIWPASKIPVHLRTVYKCMHSMFKVYMMHESLCVSPKGDNLTGPKGGLAQVSVNQVLHKSVHCITLQTARIPQHSSSCFPGMTNRVLSLLQHQSVLRNATGRLKR